MKKAVLYYDEGVYVRTINVLRFDEKSPFGDMSACRANARREGFPRANLRARGVLSYNDTGADAEQHGKGFLLRSEAAPR